MPHFQPPPPRITCAMTLLFLLICSSLEAQSESGELNQTESSAEVEHEERCGFKPVILGIADGFIAATGLGAGTVAANSIAMLSDDGAFYEAHQGPIKRGAQVAVTMLCLSVLPMFLLDEIYSLAYFFGAGAGVAQAATGLFQMKNLGFRFQERNKAYQTSAALTLIVSTVQAITFSILAGCEISQNDYCGDW